MYRFGRNHRGISPVILGVIVLVLFGSVAVYFLLANMSGRVKPPETLGAITPDLGGNVGTYTGFEKVELQSAVCSVGSDVANGKFWNITCTLKNSGPSAATLTNVFVNDIQVSAYSTSGSLNNAAVTSMGSAPKKPETTIDSGQTIMVNVYIDDGYPVGKPFGVGTPVSIKFHSANGMDYMKLVELV